MLTHWIWFAGLPGLTERQKAGLLARGLDPEDLYCGDLDQMLSDVPAGERDCLRNRDLTGAEEVLRLCTREDVEVLTMANNNYIAVLRCVAKVGYNHSILIVQSIHHRLTINIYKSEYKG